METDDSQDWGEGEGPSVISLYYLYQLTNIQAFICNFACKMTVTYFYLQRLYLRHCYSTRFTTLSKNNHLIDWWCEVIYVCLLGDLILGFCFSNFDTGNRWIQKRIDYQPCIKNEPTNQVLHFIFTLECPKVLH